MISRKLVRKFFQKNRAARQLVYRASLAFQRRRFLRSIVHRSLVGSLTSNGKKLRAIKTFYATIRYLRFVFDFQRPLQFIFDSISIFRPLFAVRLFRKGGTVHQVPSPINFKRSLLQVFGWFRRAVKNRKERYYHERFLGELSSLLRFTGETYKHYKTYHSAALENRTLMRRALTPYRSLKIRRRRRRKNYRFRFLRRRRRRIFFGIRLRRRYVRNRFHNFFIVFRQFLYYFFFYGRSKLPTFTDFPQLRQLFYYMFAIHKKLKRERCYKKGLPVLADRFRCFMNFFFFRKKKIHSSIIYRCFGIPVKGRSDLSTNWPSFFYKKRWSKQRPMRLIPKRKRESFLSSNSFGAFSLLARAPLRSQPFKNYNFENFFSKLFVRKRRHAYLPWSWRKRVSAKTKANKHVFVKRLSSKNITSSLIAKKSKFLVFSSRKTRVD